jgi:hypothetical protein
MPEHQPPTRELQVGLARATRHQPGALRESRPSATGPTIRATHDQACGWCRSPVAAAEPVTYTRESGWCHPSCTTTDVAETRSAG